MVTNSILLEHPYSQEISSIFPSVEETISHSQKNCQFTSAEIDWEALRWNLRPRVERWVRGSNIPIWIQRDEIVAEILQEGLTRTYIRVQEGERGEKSRVESVTSMAMRICHNIFIDMVRRDRRLVYIAYNRQEEDYSRVNIELIEVVDLEEVASDNVFVAALFDILAAEIALYSPKLRKALLIDIAGRMVFGKSPTLLQQSFLKQGIDLREYRGLIPDAPVEKARYNSLLSLALKKVAQLTSVQKYIALNAT